MSKIYEKDGKKYLPNGKEIEMEEIIDKKTYYLSNGVLYKENGEVYKQMDGNLLSKSELEDLKKTPASLKGTCFDI